MHSVRLKTWVGRAAGLACALALSSARAEEGTLPKETRLAVVDVSRVFENYKRVQEVERGVDAEFTPRKQALEKEGLALGEANQELNRKRGEMDGNSPVLFDEVQRFQKRQFLFTRRRLEMEEAMVAKMREEMRKVLNEIKVAIHKEASRRQIHIVFRTPDAVDPVEAELHREPAAQPKTDPVAQKKEEEIKMILNPTSVDELLIRLKRNPVLFGAPAIDITAEVLRTLNSDYAKSRGGSEPSR